MINVIKNKAQLVSLLLGLVLTNSVFAEWVEIGRQGSEVIFFDLKTVRKTDNGRRAWVLDTWDKPVSSVQFRSIKRLVEFDCDAERSRWLTVTTTKGPMGTGDVIITDDAPRAWRFHAPETKGSFILRAACKLPISK